MDVWLRLTTATRSIVSLCDLDWECYQYLQSFVIPPFPVPNSCPNVDPCEVDLDEPGDDVTAEEFSHIQSFEHFGIGSIGYHPLLSSYFICGLSPQDSVGSEQVLQYLMDYLSEQQQQHNGHNHSSSGVITRTFHIESFIIYLCRELSVSNLAEVGVYIQGDLRAERLALQHAVHSRYRLFVETTKAELALFNQQMHALEDRGRPKAHKRTKRKRREQQEAQEGQEVQEGQEAQETQEGQEGQEGQETQEDQEAQEGQDAASSMSNSEREGGAVAESSGLEGEGAPAQTAGSPAKDDLDSDMDDAGLGVDAKKVESTTVVQQSEKREKGYKREGFESKMGVFWSDEPFGQLRGLLPYLPSSCTGSSVLDSRAAGRWGEALVYQYLLSQCAPGGSVHWLNQVDESRAAYDFIVTAPVGAPSCSSYSASNSSSDLAAAACRLHPGHTDTSAGGLPASAPSNCRVRTEYVEVKTTRFVDRNVFEISPGEWQFASADSRVPYHIYRVYSAGDAEKVRMVVVRDICARVQEGRIKLCMAV